jgi:hypothetical protein
MNLGEQLRTGNLKRAWGLVDSLPQHKDELGGPRYSRNKDLAKWQAAAVSLAQEVRRLAHNT